MYGAPFASIPRDAVLSRLEQGLPFHLGGDAHRVLGSFRDRFADLLGRSAGDPEAYEDAFALSIESRSGLECLYGIDVRELASEALARLPGDLVVFRTGERIHDVREVGRKVGGAAKDLAALRGEGMTLEKLLALEAAGDEEALASIDKESVFPAMALEDLRARGVPPAVAFLFTVIHRALPRRPPPHAPSRAVFVSHLLALRGGVLDSKRVDEVQGLLFLPLPPRLDVNHRQVFGRRFLDLTPFAGFVDFGPWDRAREIEGEPEGERAWDLARRLLDRGGGEGEGERGGEARPRAGEKPLPARRKRPLDEILREGPPVTAQGPQDLLDRFGLTGIEFGNWVAREEGGRHVMLIAGAFQDLQEVLGLDLRRLARSGNLALALGSRGRGRACAHYEPQKRVINLTRTACDGSVAHELAHFLDHMAALRFAGFEFGGRAFPGLRRFLSEEKHAGASSPPPLRAMGRLLEVIQRGEVEEVVASKPNDEWYERDWILRWIEEAGGDAQVGLDRIRSLHAKSFQHGKEARANSVCLVDSMARWLGRPLALRIRYSTSTGFNDHARALGPYWEKRSELFARTFESFVEDELLAQARRNEYLVDGTREEYGGCRGYPYPRGEERRRIHDSLREFISTIREW